MLISSTFENSCEQFRKLGVFFLNEDFSYIGLCLIFVY